MNRTLVYGSAALCVAAVVGLLMCTQNDNPFEDPDNATFSISPLMGTDTIHERGDTAFFELCMHLPYLADSIIVAVGDSAYRLAPPREHDRVDWCDTISHVAGDTGTLVARASAWLGMDQPLSMSADIRVSPSALDTASCRALRPGDSITEALRVAQTLQVDAAALCPEPGFYDGRTIRVLGKIRLVVD